MITFDGGTAGTPCGFAQVNPLRDKYAGFGVRFRGPNPADGGAILDQCGAFGVDARSGLRFLAFNTGVTMANGGVPRPPETILFDNRKRVVQIWVSQGVPGSRATFKLIGKRSGQTVSTSVATTMTNDYMRLRVTSPGGIGRVVLRASDPDHYWVADDLAVSSS